MRNSVNYKQAKERLEAKYGFYGHLSVYLAVNALLIVINLVNYSGQFWFIYPLLGWGIGVFFHAVGTFVFRGRKTVVTERMIEREMNRRRYGYE